MTFPTLIGRSMPLAVFLAAPFMSPAFAQSQAEYAGEDAGEVLTTVTAPRPPALEGLAEGPEIEGFV